MLCQDVHYGSDFIRLEPGAFTSAAQIGLTSYCVKPSLWYAHQPVHTVLAFPMNMLDTRQWIQSVN